MGVRAKENIMILPDTQTVKNQTTFYIGRNYRKKIVNNTSYRI